MNLFGFSMSPKSLDLIEHEWMYNRSKMIVHFFRRLLEFFLVGFIGAMASVGGLLYVWIILDVNEPIEIVSYLRIMLIIFFSASAVFTLRKLANDFYYAAELGYNSVNDYLLNSKPEVRLMKMREESSREKRPKGHE